MMKDVFNKYLNRLSDNLSILPDKQEETAVNTLTALWLTAAGTPVSVVKADGCELPELSTQGTEKLEELINKRIDNVPLAHLTGRQSFMGIEMLAGPEALIPRKETEILANTAIEILKHISVENPCVIDVCTGAGNIALAIANSTKTAKVYAADLAEDAVELARKNADFLGLASQVDFFSGDLLVPFDSMGLHGKVHLLTCNPPYISTSKVSDMPDEISKFEPDMAFNGGAFGINLIRRLITDAATFLSENGFLVFEVGLGQGEIIKKQVEKTNIYTNIKTVDDSSGNPRVVVAQKI